MSKWLQGEPIHHMVAIAGCVIESGAGPPIHGALVKIAGRQEQAHTAKDGHFHFLDLPLGKYELEVSAHGYVESTQTVNLKKNKLQIFDVNLSMQKKNT